MTVLGLELEEWRDLIKVVVCVLLVTTALDIVGLFVHEGAHLFVAACLGCKVKSFQFTSLIGGGAEIYIYAGSYLVPIRFAGGFAEGLFLLVIRKYIKSRGLWIATLSCWTYAIAEIFMFMPLIDATRLLTYAVLYLGLAWPRLKDLVDPFDYLKASEYTVDLPVWVRSK